MATISSGLTLSTDYFMRNYYRSNLDAAKSSGRDIYSKIELSYEDSRALSHAAKRLLSNDYSILDGEKNDADIDNTTKSTVEAYVKTYNNAISTADASDPNTNHYLKKLKSLAQKHSEDLEEIGISVQKDGTLKINDDLLKTADKSKVGKIFGSEEEFSQKTLSYSKKLNTAIQSHIFSQATGSGLHINITL